MQKSFNQIKGETKMNLLITLVLIFGTLFTISMISSMFDFDLVKSMYPEYYKRINEIEGGGIK